MPEEVLFKSESAQSREEIASYLRRVAENLEGGDAITLKAGSESVTLEPPSRPTFEVKAEREGPTDSPGELSIEFGSRSERPQTPVRIVKESISQVGLCKTT